MIFLHGDCSLCISNNSRKLPSSYYGGGYSEITKKRKGWAPGGDCLLRVTTATPFWFALFKKWKHFPITCGFTVTHLRMKSTFLLMTCRSSISLSFTKMLPQVLSNPPSQPVRTVAPNSLNCGVSEWDLTRGRRESECMEKTSNTAILFLLFHNTFFLGSPNKMYTLYNHFQSRKKVTQFHTEKKNI